MGDDTVVVEVSNLDPAVSLDTSDAVAFPGGDYAVVHAGSHLAWSAQGTDAGSDDLTFAWSTGDANTYFNDGVGPDPFPSPDGTFPFAAADQTGEVYAAPGVATLGLTVTDDDGGVAGAVQT